MQVLWFRSFKQHWKPRVAGIATLYLQKATHINRTWESENVLDWNIGYLVSVSGQVQIKHLEWIKRKSELCDTWANGFWKHSAVRPSSSAPVSHLFCELLANIASLCLWASFCAILYYSHLLSSLCKLKLISTKTKTH